MSPSFGDAVLCINSERAQRQSAPATRKYAKNGIAHGCLISAAVRARWSVYVPADARLAPNRIGRGSSPANGAGDSVGSAGGGGLRSERGSSLLPVGPELDDPGRRQ